MDKGLIFSSSETVHITQNIVAQLNQYQILNANKSLIIAHINHLKNTIVFSTKVFIGLLQSI